MIGWKENIKHFTMTEDKETYKLCIENAKTVHSRIIIEKGKLFLNYLKEPIYIGLDPSAKKEIKLNHLDDLYIRRAEESQYIHYKFYNFSSKISKIKDENPPVTLKACFPCGHTYDPKERTSCKCGPIEVIIFQREI